MYEYNKKLTTENHLSFLFSLKDENGNVRYKIYTRKINENRSYYHTFKDITAIGTDTNSWLPEGFTYDRWQPVKHKSISRNVWRINGIDHKLYIDQDEYALYMKRVYDYQASLKAQ